MSHSSHSVSLSSGSSSPVTDKPLHVLDQEVSMVLGTSPRPYSTSWLFTGPLIEKYGVELEFIPTSVALPRYSETDGSLVFEGATYPATWEARALQGSELAGTPLEAVCLLLLQLHKAGKL